MSTTVHRLPFYLNSTEQLLISLQKLGGLVALESKGKDHPNAEWSIISAAPTTKIEHNNTSSSKDFLSNIRKLAYSANLSREEKNNLKHLPFTGGVIGAIAYDFGSTHLNYQPSANTKQTVIAGYYPWAFLFNHKENACYLVIENDTSLLSKDKLFEIYISSSNRSESIELEVSQFTAKIDNQNYSKSFSKTQEYILSGDVYQINLTQEFNSHYTGNPLNGYLKLASKSHSPFLAFFELNESISLASVSPELFLSIDKRKVTTKPIKGTTPRSNDPSIDSKNIDTLKNSKKDNAENLMIVDLLRNDLSITCNNISVPKIFEIESFELVHHLVSEINGNLKPDFDQIEAFFNAFPGGSITGAPKKRAMEIINEVESADRGFYCGSVFYFSNNNKHQSNILIRTFIFEDGTVTCNAGGGIVADSDCESEYKESLDKISKLMETLEN